MSRFSPLAALILPLVLGACSWSDEPVLGEPIELETPAGNNVAGPRFTTGPDGRIVLSWMERGEASSALRFARIDASGLGESFTVVDEPRMFVNWADLPSVLHVGGDHWVAHWLRYSADRTYSYDVVVSQSFDGGRTWSEPITAHTDGTPTEHGFVSMHRDREGVALLWLDGRDTADEPGEDPLATSMTLRSAVIDKNGQRLREQLVDDSVCDCCQTDVAVAASGPVAVYRDRTAAEVRDIYVSRFVDGAWQPGVPLHDDGWVIPGCPVNGPSIVADGERVAVAWFTAANDAPIVRLALSEDSGATFGAPLEIAAGRLAGFVGLASLGDGSLAVSWVERSVDGNNAINLRLVNAAGVPGPAHAVGATRQLRVFPQLGFHNDSLFLAWTDESDEAGQLEAIRVPLRK